MSLRDDVLIRRDTISSEDLAFLVAYVRQANVSDSLVSNFEGDSASDGAVEWTIDRKVRDTREVDLSDAIEERLRAIGDVNIRAVINPFYGIEVRDSEPAQILHYGVGGHYIPHVDAETLYKDEIGLAMWEKTLDRDLSIVYFLNDDFEGGELVFPALDLVIRPEPGMLVCFPSDHHFVHGVNRVTAGDRYTVVTWMRVKGMPTIDEINQLAMDEYHRAWPEQIEQKPRLAKGGGTDFKEEADSG